MNLLLLIAVGIAGVCFLAALLFTARSVIARAVASVFAFGSAVFCAFGFLASFELSDSPNWPWQLAYGVLGVCALITAGLLCLKGSCVVAGLLKPRIDNPPQGDKEP